VVTPDMTRRFVGERARVQVQMDGLAQCHPGAEAAPAGRYRSRTAASPVRSGVGLI
jgi:hypothetical protein